MSAIYVEITATRGSAPRDAGTVMKVTLDETEGTIGGGALEFAAIHKARDMLLSGQAAFEEAVPLGPNLGQCCGGSVSLRYTDRASCVTDLGQFPVARNQPSFAMPLWLWGAGHVGRAVVAACQPQAFRLTWIDDGPDRFPRHIRDDIDVIHAANMPLLAAHATRQADHLIFTYSHEIDLALCTALLKRGVRSIGLIGSDTKRTRFFKRLTAMGLDPSPIICPIGDKSRGKRPDQIASGVVDTLLAAPETKARA